MAVELDIYGKKALKLVMDGDSLFITGKAGTGKTTVLREITAECKRAKKNVVVLAPTGVAAKHAQGVTIHSFLRLPLGPYIPGMKNRQLYALKEEEITIVNRVDIIIIDEVSMVRCDLLDEIDDVLRHYRKNSLPFGGIQIVMFGDLYQLMPVAPEEDWEKLKEKYASPYFFSSKILEKMDCPMFELKIIHRFRYLVNDLLMNLPGLAPVCIPINKTGSQSRNFPAMVEAGFQSDNHMLMFPAGLCSRKKNGEIRDIPWTKTFVSKSVEYQRDVVPIHFGGQNSDFFYRLANFSDCFLPFNLAMMYLVDEMYKNVHKTFRVAIGKPISWQTFDKSRKPVEWAQFVQEQVYKL